MDQQTGSVSSAQALVQLLRQVGKAFKQFSGAQMQQNFAGCKPSEFRVLFIIREGTRAGVREMKVSEISRVMEVTSPTVTQLLKGLETNGLVERHIDQTDRRAVGIVLTERGERIARKAEEAFSASFQGLADYLGEEESQKLTELLMKAFHYFSERNANTHQLQWNGDEDA